MDGLKRRGCSITKRTNIRCQCGTKYTIIIRTKVTCCAGCQMNLCSSHQATGTLLSKGKAEELSKVQGPWHEPDFFAEESKDGQQT